MSTKQKPVGKRCYETHPPLEIVEGIRIYGGSCSHPIVKDADIYVGFDGSMMHNQKLYPWHETQGFLFRIPDMGVPSELFEFKNLLNYLAKNLKAGKKIHIGCIGGHGRTGLVLSALRHKMAGDEDATSYVRKHYCKKAVESQKQIDFLHKHFGIKKVEPVKKYGGGGQKSMFGMQDDFYHKYKSPPPMGTSTGRLTLDEDRVIDCIPCAGSVWGENKI